MCIDNFRGLNRKWYWYISTGTGTMVLKTSKNIPVPVLSVNKQQFTRSHGMAGSICKKIRSPFISYTTSVSDPHRFYADPDLDPDPAFFLNADPDPDPTCRI
jgi:hypothetical protein